MSLKKIKVILRTRGSECSQNMAKIFNYNITPTSANFYVLLIRLGSLGFIDRKAERSQVYLVKWPVLFLLLLQATGHILTA